MSLNGNENFIEIENELCSLLESAKVSNLIDINNGNEFTYLMKILI